MQVYIESVCVILSNRIHHCKVSHSWHADKVDCSTTLSRTEQDAPPCAMSGAMAWMLKLLPTDDQRLTTLDMLRDVLHVGGERAWRETRPQICHPYLMQPHASDTGDTVTFTVPWSA